MKKLYLIPNKNADVLFDNFNELLKAHFVASACATVLVSQTKFSSKLFVTLPEDQALAADHAKHFDHGEGRGYSHSFFSSLNLKSP